MNKEKRNSSGLLYMICMTAIAVVMTVTNVVMFTLFIKDRQDNKKNDSVDVINEVINGYKGEAGTENQNDDSKNEENDKDDVKDKDDEKENPFADKSAEEIKNSIKAYMTNGTGVMSMLRDLFPENVVVYDSNRYLFLDVDENVEKNDIINSNLYKNQKGEIEYKEDGKVTSIKGIDVSRYQGAIDWKKVAADGVEYAMLRVGYRGYGTGSIVKDENFDINVKGATENGIKVGVYFFSEAITEKEAVEEAEFVLDCIKDYDIEYPIVFDTEDIVNDDARTEGLTVDELTNITIAFCEHVKKNGYTPMIYANLRRFTISLDMSKLEDYEKWYAYYDSSIYFPYKIQMWQYSESGSVDGITGKVDMNISFKDWTGENKGNKDKQEKASDDVKETDKEKDTTKTS